jgi:hypothetical protein
MAAYLVTTVWWPDGWEPKTPLDVPTCLAQAREQVANEPLSYEQALAIVRGLNQQNMDHPGATWHVVAGVKGPWVLPADGGPAMIDARQVEVVAVPAGGSRGDCSHCPAKSFPCAS